jgi:hypothetical protein
MFILSCRFCCIYSIIHQYFTIISESYLKKKQVQNLRGVFNATWGHHGDYCTCLHQLKKIKVLYYIFLLTYKNAALPFIIQIQILYIFIESALFLGAGVFKLNLDAGVSQTTMIGTSTTDILYIFIF